MDKKKAIIASAILVAIAVFFVFDLGQLLSLDTLEQRKGELLGYVDSHPVGMALGFFLLYVLITALSLPAAAVLTLAAGALFGLWEGFILVSFASTIGATLAFLAARYLLRDWVQQRYATTLRKVNRGVEREGGFYLFGLRLVPVFPFFLINLAMALTAIRTRTFYWVSQLGMLPGTLVFVNAGTQLGQIDSASGILSPGLIFSFILLGIFPLVARRLLDGLQSRKALAGADRPQHFDRNLIVIGAGSAGLVTSYIAAAVKAKVTLIEKHRMGGDCLNTGCVPSKALLRTGKIAHTLRTADRYGLKAVQPDIDFAATMERVQQVIAKIEPHDSVERYSALGVECLHGEAEILDPWRVRVNGQILSARAIVIATGARPFIPPIPGLDAVPWLSSDTVWSLRKRPERMLVLGGGPIGCELSQAFQRLGVQVTLLDMAERIMPREDPDAAALVHESLRADGVRFELGAKATEFVAENGNCFLRFSRDGKSEQVAFDQVLIATGRKANTEGLGLEKLNITLERNGTITVNDQLRTAVPTIYACGDVAGPYQFTHTAAHQAWYAAVNGLFGTLRQFTVDYRVIPWCTFTDPEVARVGLSEDEAREQGIDYEVTRYGIDDLDRAIAEGVDEGFVKVLTVPGKDTILGAMIVGHHAGDLISEFVLAMKYRLGLNKILGTIHIYPTLAESNKYVAGEWKRAHAPQKVLEWVARYHAWRRGA